MDSSQQSDWYEKEMVWWDQFSKTMAHQWRLESGYNWVLRKHLNKKIKSFFLDQKSILDLGCGTGWVTSVFIDSNKEVLGIDFSEEQIKSANDSFSQTNLKFECQNVVNLNTENYKNKFDGVLVYAFLHHLSEKDIRKVFSSLNLMMKPGGKIFFYEPVWFYEKPAGFYLYLDKLFSKTVSLFIYRLPSYFGFWRKSYLIDLNKGFTGSSPMERPLSYKFLQGALSDSNFTIESVSPEHLYSLPIAMLNMSMKPPLKPFYYILVLIFVLLEKFLFYFFDWRMFSHSDRFYLCSITAIKNKANA